MTLDPTITALIQAVATTYTLPLSLLTAQVREESGGDPWAFRYEDAFFHHYIKGSPKALGLAFGPLAACSYGLLQIMLETAMEMGFTDRPETLFIPRVGLTWGAKKMAALWAAAGGDLSSYRVALAAYNGGASLLHLPESSWPVPVHAYVDAVYAGASR